MNLNCRAVRQVAIRFAKVQYRNRPIAAGSIVDDGMNADVGDSPAAAIGSDVFQSHLLQLFGRFSNFEHGKGTKKQPAECR